MKKTYLLFILSLLVMVGCGSDKKEDLRPLIDNPTGEHITVSIDDVTYEIAPYESKRIELTDGVHELKVGDEVFSFEKRPYSGLLINPTNAQYVLLRETYSDMPIEENRVYLSQFKNLRIGDNEYYVPADLLQGVIIHSEGNLGWNYHVDEEFPEEISTSTSGSVTSYNIMKTKVYRVSDFEKEFSE